MGSEERRMNNIEFFIPNSETIPTDLRLYVGNVYVKYYRIYAGFRFEIYMDDEAEAMKVAEKIVERIIADHDESQHGVTWRTVSLTVVPQEKRYKIGTIIDWKYRVRDSY